MFLIDSHCHIDMLDYKILHKDLNDVIKKAKLKEVKFILAVSISLKSCKNIIRKIINNNSIACSCGIHPLNKEKYNIKSLMKLASHPKVIALGESGLDYFYNKDIKNIIHQKKLFRDHIRVSILLKKPIIIHNRNAHMDILSILIDEKIESGRAIIHCFTEDTHIAKKFLDMGLYLSFSGMITFNNVEKIIQTLRFVPLDRLLIETDSPYLSPVPYRGKENQPAFVRDIAEYIAKVKNVDIHELSIVTKKNFCDIFNISLI